MRLRRIPLWLRCGSLYVRLPAPARTLRNQFTPVSVEGITSPHVIGDFNGDGKDDIALNLPGESTISIYYSNGDGTFYQGVQVDPGQYPGAMVVGDFNGDGRPDLAVGLMLSQQACILFNNGNGEFTRSFFASGAFAVAITTSDLNRDGKPDLVIGNFVLDSAPANVDVVFHQ
jgi:FG-GAP-like repeat/FG-GAP repeat